MTQTNPYVGPQTFSSAQSHLFFGREREARSLLATVISNRLTLFYAQSGAGKSSLLNTRLIPQLRQNGFVVLPKGRLVGEAPTEFAVKNIYIFNLLQSLNQAEIDTAQFANLSLATFASKLTTPDGEQFYYQPDISPAAGAVDDQPPHVLIIDQFEELLTTHPDRWSERADFFEQVAQLMKQDPLLWLVLTLREDYLAPLEPYAHLLPGKMQNHFYMQRLETAAALEAIEKPAAWAGSPFEPGAAKILVNNLRRIKVHGHTKTALGQFVEPVQLQVVCYRLWERLNQS